MPGRNTRMTQDEFIAAAIAKHGQKYDYSEVVFVAQKLKVKIRCPQHGPFIQNAASHIHGGRGCPECGLRSPNKKPPPPNVVDPDRFIARCRASHGDRYDYSEAKYTGIACRVTIVCRKHQVRFTQVAHQHAMGRTMCRACRAEKRWRSENKKTTEQFIEQARSIHGDKYDYSKTTYSGAQSKLIVVCPTHGEWKQLATNHLAGYGCPECAVHKLFHEKHIPLAERDDPAVVYVLKIRVGHKRFAKLGYTSQFKGRAASLKTDGIAIIEKRLFHSTKFNAFRVERETHLAMKPYRADTGKRFGGMRECYPLEMFNQLLMEVTTRIADGKVRAS